MRQSTLRRAIASVVLSVSTVVSASLPVADAYVERAAAPAYSHVEEQGAQSCLPAHDELACQLCRVLRLGSTPGSNGVAARAVVVASHAPETQVARAAARTISGAASPRAPPLG